jgi:hypothetical protein
MRFFDRVEVGALKVFDQRKLKHFQISRLPDDDRRFRKADFLGRTPAPFTRNQFLRVAHRPDNEGLDDSALPD